MASSSSLLLIAAVALLISPALSQTYKSPTFSQHHITFANCTDLPTLKASHHWLYEPAVKPNPTLSVAVIAPPAKPDGWVAWGLNPTATGMVGTQAFVAFKQAKGSAVVKTYNNSTYGPISESKLSYDVLSKSTEATKGTITIYATLALSAGSADPNQVWQDGSAAQETVAYHDVVAEIPSFSIGLTQAEKYGFENGEEVDMFSTKTPFVLWWSRIEFVFQFVLIDC